MNLSRRPERQTLRVAPAPACAAPRGVADKPPPAPACGLYTWQTAPDYASRLALSRPLTRLHDGAGPGTDLATAVHSNFARLIEQNFASASPAQVARWCDTVEPRSLSSLAQTYLNATEHRGQSAWALDILAQRLDPARLAQLGAHFGDARVQAAVSRVAPGKVPGLALRPGMHGTGPVLGDMRLRGAAPAGAGGASRSSPCAPFLDYSLEQIYLVFRTAPLGATGVAAAMFQTGLVLGATLAMACDGSPWAGGYLRLGRRVYPVSAWALMADGVAWWLHQLSRHATTPPAAGAAAQEDRRRGTTQLQREGFIDVFELDPGLYDGFAITGGDYGCAHECPAQAGA